MERDKLHEQAKVFADKALRSLGMYDPMTIARGDAEYIWDLAYDAFMYRTLPSLAMASPPSAGIALAPVRDVVQDDAAFDDTDGTFFGGGKL